MDWAGARARCATQAPPTAEDRSGNGSTSTPDRTVVVRSTAYPTGPPTFRPDERREGYRWSAATRTRRAPPCRVPIRYRVPRCVSIAYRLRSSYIASSNHDGKCGTRTPQQPPLHLRVPGPGAGKEAGPSIGPADAELVSRERSWLFAPVMSWMDDLARTLSRTNTC